jgi:hypothetical protein
MAEVADLIWIRRNTISRPASANRRLARLPQRLRCLDPSIEAYSMEIAGELTALTQRLDREQR